VRPAASALGIDKDAVRCDRRAMFAHAVEPRRHGRLPSGRRQPPRTAAAAAFRETLRVLNLSCSRIAKLFDYRASCKTIG
jgi:hypothetical protein